MTLSAVATRYANALADVVTAAASKTPPPAAVSELRAFESTLRSSADLHSVLTSPAVPASRKKAVVSRIAAVLGLSKISQNFLFVLVDHRRIPSLAEIIQTFEEVVDQRLGFARAEIRSARELSEPQRASLTRQLEHLTGKRIRPKYEVDDSLIGGVVARIGSTVYDGSVRAQLGTLERRLSAEV